MGDLIKKHKHDIDSLKSLELSRGKSDLDGNLARLQTEHEKEVNRMQEDIGNLLEKFNQENSANEENIARLKGGHEREIVKMREEIDVSKKYH